MLPPGLQRSIASDDLRRWLSRGRLRLCDRAVEPLHRVLEEIGQTAEGAGLAALRLWGQTGERSASWMMAADPVHLQTHLDHLTLHSLTGQLQLADLRPLFTGLQARIGSEDRAFARVGSFGYVRAGQAVASAGQSADIIAGLPPDEYMPAGPGSESYHLLLSEVQMALHENPVNESRSTLGLPAINSLWFWGGGTAPEAEPCPIHRLYADDPLFRGYWLSRMGPADRWTADLSAMAQSAAGGFVAVMPPANAERRLEPLLQQLRHLLRNNRIGRATLIFADGLKIRLRRFDRLRIMRPMSPLLERQ